jgi:hypothetical protein
MVDSIGLSQKATNNCYISTAKFVATTLLTVGVTAQSGTIAFAANLAPVETVGTTIAQLPIDFKPNLKPIPIELKLPTGQCDPEVETSARRQYAIAPSKGLSLEQFVGLSCASFAARAKSNQSVPIMGYPKGGLATPAVCKANGNFEVGNLTNWQGANNGTLPRTPLSLTNPANWVAGLGGGPIGINLDTSHQELVTAGADPTVSSISQIPPSGGSNAVRIGNTQVDFGGELISKTFTVTAADAIVGFRYAAFLHDGGHNAGNPKFMVRVIQAGTDVTYRTNGTWRVNLGSSTGAGTIPHDPNVLIADKNNPFFKTQPHPGGPLAYKDWDCAEINLGDLIGQTVTVEFITLDCTGGAHFAYAYLDDFCTDCGKGPTGSFKLDAAASSSCGPGKVCYDVEVPKTGKQTGTADLKLDIWQNGVKLTTLTAPTQTSDGKVCVNVNPSSVPGFDPTKDFDYSATSEFKVGSAIVGTRYSGTGPDGTVTGKNNDYKTTCTQPPTGPISTCCPPMDTKLFGSFFKRIDPGNITSPYGLKFDPVGLGFNVQYTDLLNAYKAYYNVLNYQSGGAITDLTIGVYLVDGGTGNTPVPTVTPIEQAFIGFSSNGITQPSAGAFFNTALQPNKWYGIKEYSYTNIAFPTSPKQADAGFAESCNQEAKTWVRWQLINGRMIRQTINDGKLESIELNQLSK